MAEILNVVGRRLNNVTLQLRGVEQQQKISANQLELKNEENTLLQEELAIKDARILELEGIQTI